MAHADTEKTVAPDDAETPETAMVDLEFASALARLGMEMPPDLAPGVLAGHRSLRAMSRLLRDVEIADA